MKTRKNFLKCLMLGFLSLPSTEIFCAQSKAEKALKLQTSCQGDYNQAIATLQDKRPKLRFATALIISAPISIPFLIKNNSRIKKLIEAHSLITQAHNGGGKYISEIFAAYKKKNKGENMTATIIAKAIAWADRNKQFCSSNYLRDFNYFHTKNDIKKIIIDRTLINSYEEHIKEASLNPSDKQDASQHVTIAESDNDSLTD